MMRLILAFIILAIAIFIGLHLSNQAGYVLIAYNGWTLETTVWFAFFALLILFILIHLLIALLHKPSQWLHAFHEYRENAPARREKALLRKQEYLALEQNLYLASMKDFEKHNQNEELDKFFKKMPYRLKHNPILVKELLQYLIDSHQYAKAEKMIRKALKKNPQNESLIELYGKCPYSQKQMAFAESLLSKNPDSKTLYLCLGRLCMHWQLWGKAKNYLEKSIALEATPEAYQALGLLYESIHDTKNAYAQYKEGLYLVNKEESQS